MRKALYYGAALAALALLASVTAGWSSELRHRSTIVYEPYYKFGSTSAQITAIPQPTSAAGQAELAAKVHRWEVHCKPVPKADDYGVIHLSYAHPGCTWAEGE